jgi:hypothetical protein
MFGSDHYVPVLKVKRGEKAALGSLSVGTQRRITPLLEIVERKADKPVDAHLNTAFMGLADSVRPYSRTFLDAREIASDGPAAAAEVFRRAAADGIIFAPVTGISRSADVGAALDHRTHGLVLRLTRKEFEAGGLAADLSAFMNRHSLAPGDIDLVIDLGPVDDMVTDGVIALTNAFLADVPSHTRWRTFTVSACAFPASMGGVNPQSHQLVERADWLAWRNNLHSQRDTLPRLPTFSDCVIQHPRGVEGFDPRIMQISASVRYTQLDSWLLIKGASTRITPPSTQFPNLATMLVYGYLQPHFAGQSHCDGCASMKASADGANRLGSAEVWRRLGTIHHITTVVEQLDSLPSS